MKKVLPFLIMCFATVAIADDFKLVSGKEYKNVTVLALNLTASCSKRNRES